MLATERRKIILEKLQSEKRVIVQELSEFFNVSDETIRRDIDRLSQEGLAIKEYGGATLNEKGPDLPFNVRKIHNPEAKKQIGEKIAELVNDGDSVILDASTTAVFVARALKAKNRLTVITNSIEVLMELADKPDWKIISTGGEFTGDYLAFYGEGTAARFEELRADLLIMSCKAFDPKEGVFESNYSFAQVKKAMIKSAKKKILAVDSSKIGKTAFVKIADTAAVDIIVTEQGRQR